MSMLAAELSREGFRKTLHDGIKMRYTGDVNLAYQKIRDLFGDSINSFIISLCSIHGTTKDGRFSIGFYKEDASEISLNYTYFSRNIKDLKRLADNLEAKGYKTFKTDPNYIDTAKSEGLIRKKVSGLTAYTNAIGPTGHHVAMLNYSGDTKDIMVLFTMAEFEMENIDTSKRPISFSE